MTLEAPSSIHVLSDVYYSSGSRGFWSLCGSLGQRLEHQSNIGNPREGSPAHLMFWTVGGTGNHSPRVQSAALFLIPVRYLIQTSHQLRSGLFQHTILCSTPPGILCKARDHWWEQANISCIKILLCSESSLLDWEGRIWPM